VTEGLRVPSPRLLVSLYREHGRALRAYLRARVRDHTVVEDLLQDVFLAALARGVPEGETGPWLFAIARNKVWKHARDAKTGAPLDAETVCSAAMQPDVGASDAEERERVRRAVAALEPDLREAVALRYEADLPAPEIARLLVVPLTTVESRLKRAREALLARMKSQEALS
jgi:RNA polymerase sigma-70 factor (ECF subfamily)